MAKKSFWAGRTVNTSRKDMVYWNGGYYITSSAAVFLGSATAEAIRQKPPQKGKQ